jgi:hypothetical protein
LCLYFCRVRVLPHLLPPEGYFSCDCRDAPASFCADSLDCFGDLAISVGVGIGLFLFDVEIFCVLAHDDEVDGGGRGGLEGR